MLTPRAASTLSAHLQRRAATCLEVCKDLEEAATAVQGLKRYLGNEDDKRSDSRLLTLGVALIAFPEPIISDILGAAFLAVGLLKKKTKKIGVRDVYEEMGQALHYIKDIEEHLQRNNILRIYSTQFAKNLIQQKEPSQSLLR